MSTLERWETQQPASLHAILPDIVPLLDPYLTEQSAAGADTIFGADGGAEADGGREDAEEGGVTGAGGEAGAGEQLLAIQGAAAAEGKAFMRQRREREREKQRRRQAAKEVGGLCLQGCAVLGPFGCLHTSTLSVFSTACTRDTTNQACKNSSIFE